MFRDGGDLTPRLGTDGLIECDTGILWTDRAIWLSDDTAQVERFGIAYTGESIPEGFKPLQRGRDAAHDELMPPERMTILCHSRDGC